MKDYAVANILIKKCFNGLGRLEMMDNGKFTLQICFSIWKRGEIDLAVLYLDQMFLHRSDLKCQETVIYEETDASKEGESGLEVLLIPMKDKSNDMYIL